MGQIDDGKIGKKLVGSSADGPLGLARRIGRNYWKFHGADCGSQMLRQRVHKL